MFANFCLNQICVSFDLNCNKLFPLCAFCYTLVVQKSATAQLSTTMITRVFHFFTFFEIKKPWGL